MFGRDIAMYSQRAYPRIRLGVLRILAVVSRALGRWNPSTRRDLVSLSLLLSSSFEIKCRATKFFIKVLFCVRLWSEVAYKDFEYKKASFLSPFLVDRNCRGRSNVYWLYWMTIFSFGDWKCEGSQSRSRALSFFLFHSFLRSNPTVCFPLLNTLMRFRT